MNPQKKAIFGMAILLLVIFALARADVGFWAATPAKKFALATRTDIRLLEKNHYLPPAWSKIKSIEVSSDASHVQNWLTADAFDIPRKKDGEYNLEIFVSEWIDGYRYGALVQYDLVEIKTKNTIWELNRTYKLGVMY